MTKSEQPVLVRVTHRFAASAERVYDAFLDPAKAAKFMFATATGRIVQCEIDARVGGTFSIVDRRNGEDVAHVGTYLELERPHRIVFTFSVAKYSTDADKVTIAIAPLAKGCELTLTHEIPAKNEAMKARTREGWTGILEVAGELLVDDAPTCGIGVAQHATIPAKIAQMFEGLAETFELHRKMLVATDPNTRREDDVYRELATTWSDIARRVHDAAIAMRAQRDLPVGAHDPSAWSDAHLRAFEKFVDGERQLLASLRVATERDEAALLSLQGEG
ncbi:SRPBCC domain-containing protein [Pendulispora albinea]|uniref:SRPBCC domain-containing protein n=1 Tax=Pendulispora albinea TaxID=2741071 RepID=A0ABZ2LRJ0_9BACT